MNDFSFVDPNVIEIVLTFKEIADLPLYQQVAMNNLLYYGLEIGYFKEVSYFDDNNTGTRHIKIWLTSMAQPEFIKLLPYPTAGV